MGCMESVAHMAEKNKMSLNSGVYDVYITCERSLKRFLGRFLYRKEDIDDMAQEAFLRAYKATEGRDIEFPKAYLFRVAKNLALKELGRKSKQMTDYLEESLVEDETNASDLLEEHLVAEQKINLYFDAIAELPPQCRRVFLMRKVQALPHLAIANELGISKSAVEKHIAIGVARCHQYMKAQETAHSSVAAKSKAKAYSSPKLPRGN